MRRLSSPATLRRMGTPGQVFQPAGDFRPRNRWRSPNRKAWAAAGLPGAGCCSVRQRRTEPRWGSRNRWQVVSVSETVSVSVSETVSVSVSARSTAGRRSRGPWIQTSRSRLLVAPVPGRRCNPRAPALFRHPQDRPAIGALNDSGTRLPTPSSTFIRHCGHFQHTKVLPAQSSTVELRLGLFRGVGRRFGAVVEPGLHRGGTDPAVSAAVLDGNDSRIGEFAQVAGGHACHFRRLRGVQ